MRGVWISKTCNMYMLDSRSIISLDVEFVNGEARIQNLIRVWYSSEKKSLLG